MEYFVAVIIWGPGVIWIVLRLLGAVKPSRSASGDGADELARGGAWFIGLLIGIFGTASLLLSVFGTVDVSTVSGFFGGLVMGGLSIWLGYKFANWLVFGSNNAEEGKEK